MQVFDSSSPVVETNLHRYYIYKSKKISTYSEKNILALYCWQIYACRVKVEKVLAWIQSHHLHLWWISKLWARKFAWGVKAKHCWVLSINFRKQKVCWYCQISRVCMKIYISTFFLERSNFAVNSIFYSLPNNNLNGLWAKYNLTSICENDPCKRSIGIAL